MRYALRSVVLLMVCCGVAGHATALDLRVAHQSALVHDAQFRSAIKEKEAGVLFEEIGRASLLPQVQWTYSNNKNDLERTSIDSSGRPITDNPNYRSTSNVISLRQPLVDFESLARYRQGLAQSEQALANFDRELNSLTLRLFDAYAGVLLSTEQVALLQAESAAYEELMKANEALWKKGEGTRTDAIETRSRFLVAQAQLAEATGGLETARRRLEGIVGQDLRAAIGVMRGLSKDFSPAPLTPSTLVQWQSLAREGSPDIRSMSAALDVAWQDFKRAQSAHMPRVDLVASVSRSLSETPSTKDQRQHNRSLGVQLNVPIYSGGRADASSRQASANHEKVRADVDAVTNDVMVDVHKQFNLLVSGAMKINAFRDAVASAEHQVVAMRRSIAGGQRVNTDVLNAIQQLRAVQRDQAEARYSYLGAWLRLKAHTKALGDEDLAELTRYFDR